MTAPVTHTLVLVRHAEAEAWAVSDAARALTPAGIDAAREAGDWLRAGGIRPDLALVSSAVRTRQTWEVLASAAGWDIEPSFEEALYVAGPENLLHLMRETPEETGTLLVLGHNPTIHYLAQLLADGAGDPVAETQLLSGYPPASAAVLSVDQPWDRLAEAYGRLVKVRLGHR